MDGVALLIITNTRNVRKIIKILTNTSDSISRVSGKTRAVEGSFSVGTVCIIVTIVSKILIIAGYLIWKALVHI